MSACRSEDEQDDSGHCVKEGTVLILHISMVMIMNAVIVCMILLPKHNCNQSPPT